MTTPQGKSQDQRLFDVFVLGPIMIYAATQPKLTNRMKLLFVLMGAGIMLNNAVNYLNIAKMQETPNA